MRLRPKLDPLVEEFLSAVTAMVALIALISALYWAFTGLSPWPELILVQIAVFGSGIGMLTLLSPRRRP
jgi:hypothetical protein